MKYTHKTSDGSLARVLCDDIVGVRNCAVAILVGGAEIVRTFHKDSEGSIRNHEETLWEISPWDDVPVDTPVWVRDSAAQGWFARHFAKYENGVVVCWRNGLTSHSTGKGARLKFRSWEHATLENPNGN